jgi:Fe-S-cluster containining protein
MPFGLSEDGDGPEGETFEWALQTDACGDCTFYAEGTDPGSGECTIYGDRPLICETYPFSVGGLADEEGDKNDDAGGVGTTEPMGGVVDRKGSVRAHECEGLGRDISRADAEELARTLKERAIRELEEAVGVRDNYEPIEADGIVVHDSEGRKRVDGTPIESSE